MRASTNSSAGSKRRGSRAASGGTARRAFDRTVYALVRQIPKGRVATYGQLAAVLGYPRAARAVGYAMKRCPHDIPWQRVVNARGGISLRANVSGMITQRIRLEHEGIPFRRGRVDLRRHRWAGPRRRSRLRLPALQKL